MPCAAALLSMLALIILPNAGADTMPTAADLPKLLNIDWRDGPEYPLGIQESACGILDGLFISAGGFSRHPKDIVSRFPDTFGGAPSGFTGIAFAIEPANEDAAWTRIPDVPVSPRQSYTTVVVAGALYAIGGFNYDAPNSYRDVLRLRREAGQWRWELLPCPLPWPVCAGSAVAIDSVIYLFGCGDYFQAPGDEHPDFHSEAGRDGVPVGAALLALDTRNIAAGWQRLPDLPGIPRMSCSGAAIGDTIYVLGGIFAPTAGAEKPYEDDATAHAYYNVVDSWAFDTGSRKWRRLPDLPDGSNRRGVAFADRYIIMVGGYRYPVTWLPDNTRRNVRTPEEKKLNWKAFFTTEVLVYDTREDRVGTADPLIERTSWPGLAIAGSTLYSLGGEGGRLWHPPTFQIGRITETDR